MTVLISDPAGVSRNAQASRVYYKTYWNDAQWLLDAGARADWVSWSAAPTIPAAGISWRYGVGMLAGQSVWAQISATSYAWVKIEIDQPDDDAGDPVDPLVWVGLVDETSTAPDGALAVGGQSIPTGRQAFVAYGLEGLLARETIVSSFFGPAAYQLGRGLAFNDPARDFGNRSLLPGPGGPFTFSDSADAADCDWWSTRDIVRYLIHYHSPRNGFGGAAIPWQFDAAGLDYLPDWDRPVIATHGRPLKDVLDELLDRRRLLGYTIDVGDGGGSPLGDPAVFRPFTYCDETIWVIDALGSYLPNAQTVQLDLGGAAGVDSLEIRSSTSQTYDQVIAEGDRVLCCGTIAAADGTLTGLWTAGQLTAYNAAASNEADYPAADERDQRQQRNADFRAAQSLERVLAWFGPGAAWQTATDVQVGDGEGGGLVDLFPYAELGVQKGARKLPFWPPGMRFERLLPLKSDHDYSGAKIADGEVADATPAGQKWEFLPPIVAIKLADELAQEGTDRYASVERLAVASEVEGTGPGAGREVSFGVRVEDEALALVLRAAGGPQSILGLTDFSPLADEIDKPAGPYDWRDNLAATIAVRADWHATAAWPLEITQTSAQVRRLWIRAGDRCQLHYVAPGTIVGLADGELQKTTGGGFVRDDRDRLKQLARAAYEWYGRQRQSLTVTFHQAGAMTAGGMIPIGSLITELVTAGQSTAIRSVVTSLRIDLAQSRHEAHRTTLQAQWAELDVLRLFG